MPRRPRSGAASRQDAAAIARRIRAFDPFPGATGTLGGETVKFWRARALSTATGDRSDPGAGPAPGTVLAVTPEGIDVATGHGVLRLTELQRAGGKRLSASDFLRGFGIGPGQVFD